MTCSVAGCDHPLRTKGFCQMHYKRWQKYGDPLVTKQGQGKERGGGYWAHKVNGVYIQDHVLAAEEALGRKLPPNAVVHHWDERRDHNTNDNLVVCPSEAYHKLLHQRMRAYDTCGNANWRKCWICKEYDDPVNMVMYPGQTAMMHKMCYNLKRRSRTNVRHAET